MTKSPIKLPTPVFDDPRHHIRLYQGDSLFLPNGDAPLLFNLQCNAGLLSQSSSPFFVGAELARPTLAVSPISHPHNSPAPEARQNLAHWRKPWEHEPKKPQAP